MSNEGTVSNINYLLHMAKKPVEIMMMPPHIPEATESGNSDRKTHSAIYIHSI